MSIQIHSSKNQHGKLENPPSPVGNPSFKATCSSQLCSFTRVASVLATRIPHKWPPFSQGSDTNWNHSTKHPRQHRLKAWENWSSWIQMFSGLAVCHVYHQLQRRPGNLLFIAMLSKTRLLESVMRGTTSSTLVSTKNKPKKWKGA